MRKLAVCMLVAAATLCGNALAQEQYPNRLIKLIVPFSPGGGIDILGRTLAPQLGERLKVPVVVENKPGASGSIGTETAAKSPADGYTVLVSVNTIIIVPSLAKSVPYDPVKDFAPVLPLALGSLSLVVHPSIKVTTVKEFIELAKSRPGKMNYASPGNGTPHHLAMELFKQRAGIDLVHVPYRGSAGYVTDLIGGQIEAAFMPIHQALPLVQAGKLVMLAAGGTQRAAVTPNVPSLAEAAEIKDIDVDMWYAMYLPAGTPKEIVARLNREVNAILKLPAVASALSQQGLQPTGGTPEELGSLTSNDLARWAKVIRDGKISGD